MNRAMVEVASCGAVPGTAQLWTVARRAGATTADPSAMEAAVASVFGWWFFPRGQNDGLYALVFALAAPFSTRLRNYGGLENKGKVRPPSKFSNHSGGRGIVIGIRSKRPAGRLLEQQRQELSLGVPEQQRRSACGGISLDHSPIDRVVTMDCGKPAGESPAAYSGDVGDSVRKSNGTGGLVGFRADAPPVLFFIQVSRNVSSLPEAAFRQGL